VLERGAIEGEIFHRGAVQALAPDETHVTPRLAALVRKQLIRPDRAQIAGEDGFRFRHLLIRDAAYDALPKAVRAELHERFAAWLEGHGTELVELDELLGYHLEQAYRYRAELGTSDDELAGKARRHLTTGGRRARRRGDDSAAVSLLQRAAALVPPAEIDLPLETDLVDALFWSDKGDDALRLAESIAERSAAAGDRVGELCGRMKADIIYTYREPEGATDRLAALVEQALPVFEAAGDDLALYTAYYALGNLASVRGHMDAALEAYERAADHSRQAGLSYEFVAYRSSLRLDGATPVAELLAWLDENEAREGWGPWLRAPRAGALARLGRFDEARTILAGVRAGLAERGMGVRLAVLTSFNSVDIELLAGDPAAAAELGAEGCRMFEELGEPLFLSTAAAKLAQALCALDRLEEAEAWTRRSEELGASDDVWTQMLWRQARAKVLARRGEHPEAERLAREAVTIGDDTDILDMQGDAYADLAVVLSLGGRPEEAAATLEQALERYERKGNLVSARRVRDRLSEFGDLVR